MLLKLQFHAGLITGPGFLSTSSLEIGGDLKTYLDEGMVSGEVIEVYLMLEATFPPLLTFRSLEIFAVRFHMVLRQLSPIFCWIVLSLFLCSTNHSEKYLGSLG